MFAKNFGISLALALFGWGAMADGPTIRTLGCTEQPGAYLCSMIDDLIVDYGMTCSGSACNTLWRTQGHDDLNLLSQLGQTLVPGDVIGADLGLKANVLASKICLTNRTGVGDDGFFAVNAENKLLPKLATLQVYAGYPSPRTCTISVH